MIEQGVSESQSGLSRIGDLSHVSGVLGCQWGDEGKGKLVDILAQHFDIVARCQVCVCARTRSLSLFKAGFWSAFFVVSSNLVIHAKSSCSSTDYWYHH